MDQSSYHVIIAELTGRALWEVKNVIGCVPDALWDREYCAMPLWKHIYHMLHSLDRWYVNPDAYQEPAFHMDGLNDLDAETDAYLSRAEINDYLDGVRKKISAYDTSLRDEMLLMQPENCEYARFTLILAQYRHLHTHMGMIMGFLVEATGLWPRVLGLQGESPNSEAKSFF